MASPIKRNNKLTAPNGYAGNIFGVSNCASFGKEKITTQTSTGALTTQPGTRLLDVAVVAGGGSGSQAGAGGGGGGMLVSSNVKVCGNYPYAQVVGGGGTSTSYPDVCTRGGNGEDSAFAQVQQSLCV